MPRPHGRSLDDFQPLAPAEWQVVQACQKGTSVNLGNQRPKHKEKALAVRAEVLRFLALGGDETAPVHENGIDLTGAWVVGPFDLESAPHVVSLSFKRCRFDEPMVLRNASLSGNLQLTGTYVPELRGDGVTCRGDLLLNHGFVCSSGLWFMGATVYGDVELSGATLREALYQHKAETAALRFNGGHVHGNVYLRDKFASLGTVYLSGLHVSQNIEIDDAMFERWHLGQKPELALSLQRTTIDGALSIRGTRLYDVSLADARVKYLRDEASSWGGNITLDGFVYETISSKAPTGFRNRLAWLRLQPKIFLGEENGNGHFCPQPWHQLIRVLQTMGHKEDAAAIGIAYQDHLYRIQKVGETVGDAGLRTTAYRFTTRRIHWLFGLFARYGYGPMRLLGWMLGVWLCCSVLYWHAAYAGIFGPSNPLIFENEHYADCASSNKVQKENWYTCANLKSEYSTFSPLAYSLDVMLPVVDLHQEDSWAPLISTPLEKVAADFLTWDHGHWIRLIVWMQTVFGWGSSLLLVAIMTGFARRAE